MKRRRDKYAAEALRNIGTAFVVGALFRDASATQAGVLFAVGLAMLVGGWFFAPRDG